MKNTLQVDSSKKLSMDQSNFNRSGNRQVAVFGLEAFGKKNSVQIDAMNAKDYFFDVFIPDNGESSRLDFGQHIECNRLIVVKKSFWGRLIQVYWYCKNNRKYLNHAELYIGGRFSLVYLILLKMFKIKIVAVERGDMKYLMRHIISGASGLFNLVEYSYKLVFKYANIIWYKEPYMKELLDKIGIINLYFIPNAVALKPLLANSDVSKEIDFLWVNRVVKERNVEWLLRFAQNITDKVVILGVRDTVNKFGGTNSELNQLVTQAKNFNNIEIKGYIPPDLYYKKSKFFVLISEYIFGNNALLEAMSYGLVPIVSNTPDTHLIVKDGENGIVYDNNFEDFTLAMQRAKALTLAEYSSMSLKSREVINQDYSIEHLQTRLSDLYLL